MGEHLGHQMPPDHAPAPDHHEQCPMVTHCPVASTPAPLVAGVALLPRGTSHLACHTSHILTSRAPEPPTPPPNRLS